MSKKCKIYCSIMEVLKKGLARRVSTQSIRGFTCDLDRWTRVGDYIMCSVTRQ